MLNDTLASIPALETQLRQAKNALSVLLGLPPSDLADILAGSSEIPVSPPEVAVGIPADLLRRRPDIRSAELPGSGPMRPDRRGQSGSLSRFLAQRDFRVSLKQRREV